MRKLLSVCIILFSFLNTEANVNSLEKESDKELPGGPENAPLELKIDDGERNFTLIYNGGIIAEGKLSGNASISSQVLEEKAITQHILLKSESEVRVELVVYGSSEALLLKQDPGPRNISRWSGPAMV